MTDISRDHPRGRVVLVGRSADLNDELWTRSLSGLRLLGRALRGGGHTLRTRTRWETRLVARGRVDEHACSLSPLRWVRTPGQVAEAVFDLLVSDGVVCRPTPAAYDAACERWRGDGRYVASQPPPAITEMWCVDKTSRDAWVSVRLLLMAGDL